MNFLFLNYITKNKLQKILSTIFIFSIFMSLSFSILIAQQEKIDEDYSRKIKEYTTEPFFMTKYVDHIPYSENVPNPEDILGHVIGTPDILHYSHEVYKYMRALADASPRVKVFTIGKTEEGRDLILVVVSDEETINNLDKYKEINRKLGDPRTISDSEAERLISESKVMYYPTGAMHSPETGSPEMLMELAYRLATGESEFIRQIRDNVIVMITPILEVDGRDKVVDLHMAPRIDPDGTYPTRPLYWGKYVAHDNNRDGMALTLALSKAVMKTFLEYHPQVVHDLHESASHLYTSTGTGPYNAWIDPILIDEWYKLAYEEVTEMTKMGVPGVWTYGFYDGWAPNYMFYAANGHNAIGRFYETQGAGNASNRIIRTNPTRAWYRPNPPLRETVWSLRNNVNLQQSALLIAFNYMARNKKTFMENYYIKSKRSVAKATTEGPAAYVFPADYPRQGQQAALLNQLQAQGIEIHKAKKDIEIGDDTFVKGSYIVRLDQPYSRMADMLLDIQYYNVNDPRPYDDVGWTLGPLFNAKTVRVEDTAILDKSMDLVKGKIIPDGGLEKLTGGSARAYIINHNADNSLITFRYENKNVTMNASEQSFTVEDMDFNMGSFIIRISDNSDDLENMLEDAGKKHGFTVYSVENVPDVPMHELDAPRVAIVHNWSNTQSEGWVRMEFDFLGVPFDYISLHDIRDNSNLRNKYDVILMGPSSNNVMSLINGLSGNKPLPWKKTDVTPNIGRQASTDDMRGGMELQGVLNLKNFIENGGAFITITSSSNLPIHFGLSSGISIRQTTNLWARGGVYSATFADRNSPISYGYGDDLGVYFNTSPVFRAGGSQFGRGGRGRGGQAGRRGSEGSTRGSRPSGRGGLEQSDIFQGRAKDLGQKAVEEFRKNRSENEQGQRGGQRGGQQSNRARTILRFERNVKNLLISGGIDGAEELAGAPAVVDSKLGDGHVVMFSINPFWRHETQGSFFLVFNTLMNYSNLDAGKK